MTLYESNKHIHETGAEIAEFDDAPPAFDEEEDGDANAPYEGNTPGSNEPPDDAQKR